jgi:Plavaka transposase
MIASRACTSAQEFRRFKSNLFHGSLQAILKPLRPYMESPDITTCPDGHFRHVIYGLGPYIADYPEQVLLSAIVQGWCAWYVLWYSSMMNFILVVVAHIYLS